MVRCSMTLENQSWDSQRSFSWGAGSIVPDIPTFKGIVLEEIVIVSETKWIKVIVLPLFQKDKPGEMAEQGVNGWTEENAGR